MPLPAADRQEITPLLDVIVVAVPHRECYSLHIPDSDGAIL
jgi:hypothetical protein